MKFELTASMMCADYGHLAANKALLPDRIREINGSTEVALLAGMDIVTIPGDEANFKVTTQEDMERYCQMVRKRTH